MNSKVYRVWNLLGFGQNSAWCQQVPKMQEVGNDDPPNLPLPLKMAVNADNGEVTAAAYNGHMSPVAPASKTGSGTCRSPPSFTANALMVFKELRDNNQLTDVYLIAADETRFAAHRALLAACSNYFKAIFTQPFREKGEEELRFQKVPGHVMKEILEFVYVRKANINNENVAELLEWSNYLAMDKLIRQCCQFMMKRMNVDNCLGLMNTAKYYHFADFYEEANSFARKNFEEIATKSQEFLQLTVRDLYKLLSNDRLNVSNEANLWHAIKRWHEHDPINRASHIGRLIKTIRLALCSHNVLEEISCDPLITNNEDCRRWIGGAYKLVYGFDNHISDSQMYELTAYKVWSPRIPSQVILAVGGWSGGSASGIIECYDQRADEWHEVSFPDPAGARAYHSCIIVNHSLFLAGGFTGQLPFNSVRTFDLKTKHWRDRASMNFRRCYLSMAHCKGLIWALGGFDGTRRLNTAEYYSHTDNHWTMIRSMTNRRSDAHAVTVDDQIYVVGGFDGADCLDTVERLHCGENNWTFAPSMGKKRSGVGAVFCQGAIYAVGGFNGHWRQKTVERYDPRTSRWQDVRDMPIPRSNCGIEVIGDKIYVIGGFNGHTTVSTVDVYDSRADRWESAASLSLHRSALYCCLLSDEEYINGEFIRMPRLFPAQKLKSMQERLTAAESAVAAAAAQNAVNSPTRTKMVKNSQLIQQQELDDPELNEDSEVD